MKEIVAFIGRAGSGKDYQCSLLWDKGYQCLAFADALRDIAFASLNMDMSTYKAKDYNQFYDTMKKQWDCITVKYGESIVHQFNFRRFLEQLGTQGIRKYDNDFWCRCVIKQLNDWLDKGEQSFCISDMRFINEYVALRDWCREHDYKFRVVFCDYHSDRYQEYNEHESARMGNYFAEKGLPDLTEITEDMMDEYVMSTLEGTQDAWMHYRDYKFSVI